MNKCLKCGSTENLCKNSVYKGVQKYLCRNCERERKQSYRRANYVPVAHKSVPVRVPVEDSNVPVEEIEPEITLVSELEPVEYY